MAGPPADVAERRPRSVCGWLIVVLLAVIATCLLLEAGFATSAARAQVGAGGQRNVFAVAGEVAPNTRGIYLVDLENGTICVYQYVMQTRRLRFVAARTFVYDVKLDDYNNEDPVPRDVKKLVEQQKRLEGPATRRTE